MSGTFSRPIYVVCQGAYPGHTWSPVRDTYLIIGLPHICWIVVTFGSGRSQFGIVYQRNIGSWMLTRLEDILRIIFSICHSKDIYGGCFYIFCWYNKMHLEKWNSWTLQRNPPRPPNLWKMAPIPLWMGVILLWICIALFN